VRNVELRKQFHSAFVACRPQLTTQRIAVSCVDTKKHSNYLLECFYVGMVEKLMTFGSELHTRLRVLLQEIAYVYC